MKNYLAEMVDSYNLIHSDYLKNDSIAESELLLQKLKRIEKDILGSGASINLSIKAWEVYIFKIPNIVKLGELGRKLIHDTLQFVVEKSHYNLLDKVFALEDEILLMYGYHSTKKAFYKNMEIMQQTDEKNVIKHVIFREYLFIKDQALNLMNENINAI